MSPLHNWIKNQILSDNFDFAGFIANELLEPGYDLNQALHPESYQLSFQNTQILLGLEVWTPGMLADLHDFLSKQCCDLSNFILIIIGHPGIAIWWESYKSLYQVSSFQIVEVSDCPLLTDQLQPLAQQTLDNEVWGRHNWYPKTIVNEQNLQYHLLYMAGTLPGSFDSGYAKVYLRLSMSQNKNKTLIDRCWPLPKKQDFLSWLDYATLWKDEAHVKKFAAIYDSETSLPFTANTKAVSMARSQNLYANCFASVVRETVMTMPYGCVSEKTYKSFLYQHLVLPTTYQGVQHLEHLGFVFDHDFFNFDYQFEINFIERIKRLQYEIEKMCARSLLDLFEYKKAHRDMFEHNQRRACEIISLNTDSILK
jgi:hypothetical protein